MKIDEEENDNNPYEIGKSLTQELTESKPVLRDKPALSDRTFGINIRWKDNLFQLGFSLLTAVIFGVVAGNWHQSGIEEVSRKPTLAVVAFYSIAGLIVGVLLSGMVLGIYRGFVGRRKKSVEDLVKEVDMEAKFASDNPSLNEELETSVKESNENEVSKPFPK